MMGYVKPDQTSYASHRWRITLQYIIISLTIQRNSIGKETKVPNYPHRGSVTTHFRITSGLYVVSFLGIRRTICNYEISPKYFSHYRGCYYCTFLYDQKTYNTEESKSITSLSTTITSSTDLHESLWPECIFSQDSKTIICLTLKKNTTKYIYIIHS